MVTTIASCEIITTDNGIIIYNTKANYVPANLWLDKEKDIVIFNVGEGSLILSRDKAQELAQHLLTLTELT